MTSQMLFPKQIKRQFKDSLVADEVFANSSDRMDYLNSPIAYAGQLVTQSDTGEAFVINSTITGYIKLGSASDVSFKIVEKYSNLPTTDKPTSDTVFYVKKDEVDAVDISVTHEKGFYIYDLGNDAFVGIGGGDGKTFGADPVMVEVGGIKVGDSILGKNAYETLQMILYPETAPLVALSLDKDNVFEIGETVGAVTISAQVTKKSYPIDEIKINVNGADVVDNTDTNTIKDGYTATYSHTVADNHTDVLIKATAIAGTTTTEKSTNIKFVRASFYGTDSVNSTAYTTSGEVRALGNKSLTLKSGSKFNISIPTGAKMVVIALPTGLSIKSIKYVEAMNTEVKDIFSTSTVSVEGANGYTSESYNLYVYVPDIEFSQAVTYAIEIA